MALNHKWVPLSDPFFYKYIFFLFIVFKDGGTACVLLAVPVLPCSQEYFPFGIKYDVTLMVIITRKKKKVFILANFFFISIQFS